MQGRRTNNALPRDRVSDRPIRVVEVTGDYWVGVYGVFRPQDFPGGANLHEVNTFASCRPMTDG
jgi:hypothetical protein